MDQIHTEVKNGEAYLHVLLNTVVDGAVTICPNGIIQAFNHAAETIFHYSAEEVIGQNVNLLMPETHRSAHNGYLENFLSTGTAKILGKKARRLEAQRKNGTTFPIELSVNEINSGEQHLFVGIIRDVSEQVAVEKALLDNASHLESIMAAVIDGLITIDDKGNIHSFNPAAESIFGYHANEVIGKNVKMLMPEPYYSELDGYLNNYANTSEAKVVGIGREVKARRKDGSIFPMDLAVSKMSADGKHMFVGIIRDISERKAVENEREKLIRELQRSNQELDDFAYIASHDLKEPLRGLFNNAIFLQEDYEEILGKDGIKRLDRMSFLCKRMEKLIDSLLYFSRIGRQDFAIQKTDINTIITDIKDTVNSYDETVIIETPGPLPEIVCDYTRITEVFRNLITNGIKYNKSDKKIIEIGFIDDYDGTPDVFYVQDNGIGIAPEFYTDVFKIFKRLNVEDDNIKGSGAGLTFVKKIIERHKGIIWLESNLGEGTTFYFTLTGENDE